MAALQDRCEFGFLRGTKGNHRWKSEEAKALAPVPGWKEVSLGGGVGDRVKHQLLWAAFKGSQRKPSKHWKDTSISLRAGAFGQKFLPTEKQVTPFFNNLDA